MYQKEISGQAVRNATGAQMSTRSRRTWLITGADKGLGCSTAKAALERGDQVVVTVLSSAHWDRSRVRARLAPRRGIEPEPYLPEEREIGAKAGRDHQSVDHDAASRSRRMWWRSGAGRRPARWRRRKIRLRQPSVGKATGEISPPTGIEDDVHRPDVSQRGKAFPPIFGNVVDRLIGSLSDSEHSLVLRGGGGDDVRSHHLAHV